MSTAALWRSDQQVLLPDRVETTRRRAAAYGHRAFNAGFPALNPIGRPSQPDPQLPFAVPRTCLSIQAGLTAFRAQEADARGHQDSAISRRWRQAGSWLPVSSMSRRKPLTRRCPARAAGAYSDVACPLGQFRII